LRLSVSETSTLPIGSRPKSLPRRLWSIGITVRWVNGPRLKSFVCLCLTKSRWTTARASSSPATRRSHHRTASFSFRAALPPQKTRLCSRCPRSPIRRRPSDPLRQTRPLAPIPTIRPRNLRERTPRQSIRLRRYRTIGIPRRRFFSIVWTNRSAQI
jgi:hypothetical protein